jgi:molybdopterin converting factor small subunit
MRDSIELGLGILERGTPPQRVLLAPGDAPGITRDLVARLLARAALSPESIVVPCCEGRRGHPIVVPWSLAVLVRSLPAGLGVNALVSRHQHRVVEMPVASADLIADLDTPDDLRRWNQQRPEGDFTADDSRPPEDLRPPDPHPPEPVRVRVRLFALAKEQAGRSEIDLELIAPSTVADLRAALRERLPALAAFLPSVMIAVDEEYAGDEAPIRGGLLDSGQRTTDNGQ